MPQIMDVVKLKYGSVATSGLSTDHAGVRAVAEAFGYTADELAVIPADANRGLSCGNPTATASLRPGEVGTPRGGGRCLADAPHVVRSIEIAPGHRYDAPALT